MRYIALLTVGIGIIWGCKEQRTRQSLMLPLREEFGIVYDAEKVEGQISFIPSQNMKIVEAHLGCGCTNIEYPRGDIKAGKEYAIGYQIDPSGSSGYFATGVEFRLAGYKELWEIEIVGEIVPMLPSEVDLGDIDRSQLPIVKRLSLGHILGHRLQLTDVEVEGESIIAVIEDDGQTLVLNTSEKLTWEDQIKAMVKTTVADNDRKYMRTLEVRGRVLPRIQLEPATMSFDVGEADRRETRQVRVVLPIQLVDQSIEVHSQCSNLIIETDFKKKHREVWVEVRNTSNFPIGSLSCGVVLHVGEERVHIPILALTR